MNQVREEFKHGETPRTGVDHNITDVEILWETVSQQEQIIRPSNPQARDQHGHREIPNWKKET